MSATNFTTSPNPVADEEIGDIGEGPFVGAAIWLVNCAEFALWGGGGAAEESIPK